MTIFEGLILGVVQGLTEFIPVSSTGHLILVREFFGFSEVNGLAIDAVLQLATVLAVLVYFHKELLNILKSALRFSFGKQIHAEEKTLLFAIVAGTIPAVILGLLLESKMETLFRNAAVVATGLLIGSALFVLAEKFSKRFEGSRELTIKKGFVIGLFQSLALIPGMSRSGSTISGGLFAGLSRIEAARFSFILSFPIIAGSGLLKLKDLVSAGAIGDIMAPLLVGFIAAFIVGILAIRFLLNYLSKNSLMAFVWYRLALVLVIIFVLL